MFWVIARRHFLVYDQRFGITCLSHLQGRISFVRFVAVFFKRTSKDAAVHCPSFRTRAQQHTPEPPHMLYSTVTSIFRPISSGQATQVQDMHNTNMLADIK
jgi:hypothetical protein